MKSMYLIVLAVFAILTIPAYADVVKPTSAGTINVGFTTDPAIPNPGDSTQIKLNFINKQTNALQPHVDYKISVIQGGDQVFGIPITHTAEGAVSIPFQFQTAGKYQVIVDVEGLVFQPIPPETVTFDLNVGANSNATGSNLQGTTNHSLPSSNLNSDKIPTSTKVPEFPFAITILLVSFVSIIIFYRIRFRR